MTTMHEPITDTVHRDQEATIKALQIWADSYKKFVGWVPTPHTKVPSAAEVVDHYFDFVGHVLDTQRHFFMSLATAVHGAAKDMEHAARDMEYATKDGAAKKS